MMPTVRLLPVSAIIHCARGCLLPGGCLLGRGVSALGRGCLLFWRGTCLWSWGVSAPGGVPASGPGGCLLLGVPASGLGGYLPLVLGGGGVSQHAMGQTPLCTDFLTHATENITLPQTSFAGGKNIVIHHHATSKTNAEKHGNCGRAISSLTKAKPRTVDLVDIFGFQLRLLPSLDFLGLIMSLPEASL